MHDKGYIQRALTREENGFSEVRRKIFLGTLLWGSNTIFAFEKMTRQLEILFTQSNVWHLLNSEGLEISVQGKIHGEVGTSAEPWK